MYSLATYFIFLVIIAALVILMLSVGRLQHNKKLKDMENDLYEARVLCEKARRDTINMSTNLAELYRRMQEKGVPQIKLAEGDKVCLNIEIIKRYPDYDRLTEKYHRFIDEHSEDVFTVVYDRRRKENPSFVCLKEDPDRWLFWTGDLIKVE